MFSFRYIYFVYFIVILLINPFPNIRADLFLHEHYFVLTNSTYCIFRRVFFIRFVFYLFGCSEINMLFRNLLETYIQFGFDIYNKFKQEKGGVNECYVLSPFNTNYTHVFWER